jgi:hypothetical protein
MEGEGTHLVVYRIKLGQDHPINPPRHSLPTSPARCRSGEVTEGTVEFGELVDGFVTDEGFANEDDFVGLVDGDELWDETSVS